MSTPDDVPKDAKSKDIPSILPLAPGGVYAVKWETRVMRAEPLVITPVKYTPPFPVNESNPQCFFELRAGGYYLGKVVFEIKEDIAPITAQNFVQLCDYHCYAGTMFKVYPSNWIVGGDFTNLDSVVYNPNDPDYFDFATLLPDCAPGGQSVYGECFDDENYELQHVDAGVLTMHNEGGVMPGRNGSQFMITFEDKPQLNNKHVAFGQVIEGYDIINALQKLGDARQEGETFQRITVERCGVHKPSALNTQASIASRSRTTARATSSRQSRTPRHHIGRGFLGRQVRSGFAHALAA
jgi:cyclophilin family peptidyl-prolyl cis-trans isomerase